MTRADELREMLREASRMPPGAAHVALVEQVIAEADALRDEQLAFAARSAATGAYTHGGVAARAFVTFGWCLAEFDRDPERWMGYQHTLLWQFKYMVSAACKVPEVPLDRLTEVVDDMERRYRETGHGQHAVYAYRHVLAWHVGDLAAAQGWYEKWDTTPPDSLSDCEGCDPTNKAYWLAYNGRDAAVIELAEPVLAGRLTCSEQPQDILAALMKPLLRVGRVDDAVDAHRRAYRRHRTNIASLSSIGEHVEFCVLTSNDAYGLEIVTRHLPWLATPPSPSAARDFAVAAGLLLRRIVAAGHGDTVIARPAFGRWPAGDTDAATLAADLVSYAYELAGAFDHRNGNAFHTRGVARTLATRPLVSDVPINAATRPAAAAPADTAAASDVVVPADGGPDELLALADEQMQRDDLDAAQAICDAFDDRYGATELTPYQRGLRAELHGVIVANHGDLAAAEIAWNSALDLFAAAGDEIRRQGVRARLGQRLCMTGQPETGLPIVVDATDYLIAAGPAHLASGAYRRRAMCFLMAGRPEDALANNDLSGTHAPASRRPHALIGVAVDRVTILAQAGQLDEAYTLAQVTRDEARAVGYRDGLASLSWLLARIEESRGEGEAALAAYDEALAHATSPAQKRDVRRRRAVILARSNRAAEAVDELKAQLAAPDLSDTEDEIRQLRFHLGHAYLNAERPLDAADEAESMLTAMDPEDPATESVRHLLANAFRALDQPDDAIAQLELIAVSGARRASPGLIAEMNEQIAEILDQLDRDALAASRFAVAADAYRVADVPLASARCRRRHAMSSMWSQDVDRAVEVLAMADREALDLRDDDPVATWERAMLRCDGARIVAAHGDLPAAITRVAPAAATFLRLDDLRSYVYATSVHTDLLLRADRAVDAEEVARRAMAEAPPAARSRLAGGLAAALEAQGRTAEADAVRQQHQK